MDVPPKCRTAGTVPPPLTAPRSRNPASLRRIRLRIPAEISYGKGSTSAVLNYVLDRGDEEIVIPLVTYSLERELKEETTSTASDPFECRKLREISYEGSPYYLYVSYERYAWRYLTDDYTFDKSVRRCVRPKPDEVILTEEEMLAVLRAQANVTVSDSAWSMARELYQAGDEGLARRCFLQTDRFLDNTGKRSVWIVEYDDYTREDTYNPLRPEKLEEPPALTVLCGGNTVEARRLTYTWIGVEADAGSKSMASGPMPTAPAGMY